MIKEFKAFLLRGNVVDLAVAVVIGAAFGAAVAALVKDLLTPLLAAIVGKPDFSAIKFSINNSQFLVGDFLNAVVAFVLVAAAIFFFVIKPMQRLSPQPQVEDEPKTRECAECLTSIPVAARRCAACGQLQAAQ
jgi:large conductance mechanosensitive channel